MIEKHGYVITDLYFIGLLVFMEKDIVIRISRPAVEEGTGLAEPQNFQRGHRIFL